MNFEDLVLCQRYIDDIFHIWSGSIAELCRFREKLGNENDNIKLKWQGTPLAEDAINPAKFDEQQHRQMHKMLTHTNNPMVWLEEWLEAFSTTTCAREATQQKAIDSTYRSSNWNQRKAICENQ
jgi:hypothetical protein